MSGDNLIIWHSSEIRGVKKFNPRRIDGKAPSALERMIVKPLAAWLESHPCIGARQLGADKTFYACILGDMTSLNSSLQFLQCLDRYLEESEDGDPIVRSLLVLFSDPISSNEDFAEKFWSFAQTTHDLDSLAHNWDASVSKDIKNDAFELSFRGRAVFPTTFHPFHSRSARRFMYPGWAHNLSSQFAELRKAGQFENWQRKIRKADAGSDPSGKENPLLADTGSVSAAAQIVQLEADHYPFQSRADADREQTHARLVTRAVQEKAHDVTEYLGTL